MELEDRLRAAGHRVTTPRRVVWDVLGSSERHLNAQEIADEVQARDPRINVSSVYRTLALFGELDLVRESHLGEASSTTWETSHDDEVIHLVCRSCGSVIHHDATLVNDLRDHLESAVGFVSESIDVSAVGLCAECGAVGRNGSADDQSR